MVKNRELDYNNFDFSAVDYGYDWIPEEIKKQEGYIAEDCSNQESAIAKLYRKNYGVGEKHPVCPHCSRPILLTEEGKPYCRQCVRQIMKTYIRFISRYEAIENGLEDVWIEAANLRKPTIYFEQ